MKAVLLLAGAILAAPVFAADACALISATTIRSALGEPVISAKPSFQSSGGVRFSHCFYTLSTFTNSISVSLTAPTPAGRHTGTARELWNRWFHEHEEGNDEEAEARGKAIEVPDIGEEAFWVHSFVGNLYVLKGTEFLRISMGGKLTDEQRLAKAKTLAGDALRRMR